MPRRAPHAVYAPARADGIGRLELTRPEKLNATDDDSLQDLARAVLVSGRGWDEALAQLEAIPVPTVAALQGACLGGGLQIALCCDLRVASAEASFGLSAVRHGIVPGLATWRLPRTIGMGAARELMLLGETWDAARAERHGLVNRVVPRARLAATALALARQLASQRDCWQDAETQAQLAGYRSGRWGEKARASRRTKQR